MGTDFMALTSYWPQNQNSIQNLGQNCFLVSSGLRGTAYILATTPKLFEWSLPLAPSFAGAHIWWFRFPRQPLGVVIHLLHEPHDSFRGIGRPGILVKIPCSYSQNSGSLGQHLFILFNTYVLSVDFWCQEQGTSNLAPVSSYILGFASASASPLCLEAPNVNFFFFQPLLSSVKAGKKKCPSAFHKRENRGLWREVTHSGSQMELATKLRMELHSLTPKPQPSPQAVTTFLKRKLSVRARRHGVCTWQVPLGLGNGALYSQSSHSNPWDYCIGLQIWISWYSPLKELSKALSEAKHMTWTLWKNKSS